VLRRPVELAIADRYRGYLPVTLRGKAVEAPQHTFAQISIEDKANASHGKTASGVRLWSSDEKNNLADLPAGLQEFPGVPFYVLNAMQNPHGSCIVLSRQSSYALQLSQPAGAKATSIYLLDAADGRAAAGLLLTIHYADGTSHTLDVEGHSWSFPTDSKYAKAGPRTEDTYRVAWKKARRMSRSSESTRPASTTGS
jgi:hypothetical protein